MDESGVRVEVYGGEDGQQNLLDHITADATVHIYHRLPNEMAQPVLTITCKQYPEGVIVTEVMDHAHARLAARIETNTTE